ncbi:MAG: CAP domain-containing protein [Alphaproteobacteria bacterium]|nr:CAP domain-containing protein [Alphaproteobacteria bacterium]
MKRLRRYLGCFLVLGLIVAAAAGLALPAQAGPYLDYATALNRSPPDGSKFRPDLEDVLAQLANAYRKDQGRRPLIPSSDFQIAARAHAADMMLHDFIGHRASTGHDFDSRMRVFVDDITRFPAMGENAARDSQKTPVDAKKARSLFSQWVKSRSHRKALASRDYAFVSTGVIQRGTTIWAVQIFWATPRQKGLFQ